VASKVPLCGSAYSTPRVAQMACQRLWYGGLRAITEGVVNLGPGQAAVLGTMAAIACLSAVACWYFSTRIERRSPGRLALVMLTGFVFLVNVLWGAVFYVSCEARVAMTFEGLVDRLWLPVLVVSVVGLAATGLVGLLILRREVRGES
jgi:hypothetical protein